MGREEEEGGREEEEGEREEEEGKEHIGFSILHYSKLIPPISLWGIDNGGTCMSPCTWRRKEERGREGRRKRRFYYCVRLQGQLSHTHTLQRIQCSNHFLRCGHKQKQFLAMTQTMSGNVAASLVWL